MKRPAGTIGTPIAAARLRSIMVVDMTAAIGSGDLGSSPREMIACRSPLPKQLNT
jgi:hypothetical protein